MSETRGEYVVNILGGPRTIVGRAEPSARDVRDRIRQGLPYRSLETVRERLHLSLPETAAILRVPLRTLARRRVEKKLASDESDRLYRLARIAAHAERVFGSDEKAAAWLRRPNRSLGGESPIEVLDTDIGAREIEDALGRLEHGIVG
jgi:putative toxin-antitoxin system antitoxin component (TIGR02293 family)